MTVVINMPYSIMSCHGFEGAMSVLCTPLEVKCYQKKNLTCWNILTILLILS